MWEAILAGQKPIIKLLSDNGANLTSGDVGLFACTAAEQNNLDLLKEIVRRGGDVTRPKSNRCTALHIAVCEGNIEIVKYLLDQGANIDEQGESGWTARDLAEQQGHEEIKQLFESHNHNNVAPKIDHPTVTIIPEERRGVHFLGRFKSEPTIMPLNHDVSFPGTDQSWGRSRPRRRTNNFHNSLFGIISAARTGEGNLPAQVASGVPDRGCAARVTVSCPEKGDIGGKLVLLPHSFEELLQICVKKYGFLPTKVKSKDGAEIDDIELIRDGDYLVFFSDHKIDQAD